MTVAIRPTPSIAHSIAVRSRAPPTTAPLQVQDRRTNNAGQHRHPTRQQVRPEADCAQAMSPFCTLKGKPSRDGTKPRFSTLLVRRLSRPRVIAAFSAATARRVHAPHSERQGTSAPRSDVVASDTLRAPTHTPKSAPAVNVNTITGMKKRVAAT